VEQIAHRLCLYGLELVQHALPPLAGEGDACPSGAAASPAVAEGHSVGSSGRGTHGVGAAMPQGGVGTAASTARARRAQLELAVRYARALGVRQLSMPMPDGPNGAAQLAHTAALLRQHGLTLVAALRSAGGCGLAFGQISELRSGGAENLYLQYRIDSSATLEGAAVIMAGRLPLIRHVRVRDAAAPAVEPWLSMLERLGYQGWVSCSAASHEPHPADYPPPHLPTRPPAQATIHSLI
jgi:hypothetical protein